MAPDDERLPTMSAIRAKPSSNQYENAGPAFQTESSAACEDKDVALYLNDFAKSDDDKAIEYILLVLHAYDVTAEATLKWVVDSNFHKLYPHICFVFPQGASESQKSSTSTNDDVNMGVASSWFAYVTDYDGKEEDEINANDLVHSRQKIISLINHLSLKHAFPLNKIGILGSSQGGCMAIDVACHVSLKMCITLVAHKLSQTMKPLCTEWHALIANRDDCFPLTWIKSRLTEAKSIADVDDDHYLEANDESNTYIETLLNLFFAESNISEQVKAAI